MEYIWLFLFGVFYFVGWIKCIIEAIKVKKNEKKYTCFKYDSFRTKYSFLVFWISMHLTIGGVFLFFYSLILFLKSKGWLIF